MILGIYGLQDAGKTTLVEQLVKALAAKGYRVSSVKHTPHRKSVDSEGKDTWRHWQAGSDPVVFSSEIETAVIKHSKMSADDIARLVDDNFHPDIIIVEGFKEGSFPKVAVGKLKPRKGTVLVNPSLKELVGYAETEIRVERIMRELPLLDCGKCGDDCEGLARDIERGRRTVGQCLELAEGDVEVRVGGARIPMGRFASKAVEGTLRGLLGSLKGYDPKKEVEVRLGASRSTASRARGRGSRKGRTH